MKAKKWPNKIYLQIEDQDGNKLDLNENSAEAITWCQDRINKSDIAYYRHKGTNIREITTKNKGK